MGSGVDGAEPCKSVCAAQRAVGEKVRGTNGRCCWDKSAWDVLGVTRRPPSATRTTAHGFRSRPALARRGVRLPPVSERCAVAFCPDKALCRALDAGSRTQVPQPPTPPKSNLTSDGFSLDVASPGTPSPRSDPHLDRLEEDGNARLRRWRLGRRVNQHSSAVSGESLPHTLSLPRELAHQAACYLLPSPPLKGARLFPKALFAVCIDSRAGAPPQSRIWLISASPGPLP